MNYIYTLTVFVQFMSYCTTQKAGIPNMKFIDDTNIYHDGVPVPWSPWNFKIGEKYMAKHDHPENRIVGGKAADLRQFPFIIGIDEEGLDVVCGGSIYATSWIVTAAHCWYDKGRKISLTALKKFSILGGEHNLVEIEGTEQIRNIKRVIIHPNYDDVTYNNDVALVKLDQPFKLSKAVAIIPIATKESKYNVTCTVAGWGYTYKKGITSSKDLPDGYPDTLRFVQVKIIEKEHCKKLHEKYAYVTAGLASILCAGILGGGKDACHADSGGPLICYENKTGRKLLVGIVSSGFGCAQKNIPGFYTNVAVMKKWIVETANN